MKVVNENICFSNTFDNSRYTACGHNPQRDGRNFVFNFLKRRVYF